MSPMLPSTTLPRGPGATRGVGVVSPVLVAITDLPCSFFLATADPYGVVVTACRSSRGPSPTGRPLFEPQTHMRGLHRLPHRFYQFPNTTPVFCRRQLTIASVATHLSRHTRTSQRFRPRSATTTGMLSIRRRLRSLPS